MKGYVLVPLHVGSNNYCTNATLLVEILPYSVAGKEHVFEGVTPAEHSLYKQTRKKTCKTWSGQRRRVYNNNHM